MAFRDFAVDAVAEWADVETSSEAYANRFAGAAGEYMLSVQEQCVLELLADLPPGSSILDVGGGHAQLTGPLLRRGFRVTTLGSSTACALRLQREISTGAVQFRASDFSRLPYADESFDAVVSVRLIPHVDDWTGLMQEFCRVARRTVVIDYPTFKSLNLLSVASFHIKRAIEKNTTRTYRSFWPREIAHAFQAGDFAVRATTPQFVLPMALHRLTKGAPLLQKIETLARRIGLTQHFGNPAVVRADRVDLPRKRVRASNGTRTKSRTARV
ncbi:methyltransferase domain-containing protein [Phenylobacterium sp. LjRoot225]|uniref:class I SAM-dependent methyltransferase n=1 Tax=Phenylobacterium sp. LjRoot225 TaxID=3342285 RepID=UPI003ECF44D3